MTYVVTAHLPPMRRTRPLVSIAGPLAGLTMLLFLSLSGGRAEAAEQRCAGSAVTVQADDAADAGTVCDAVASAVAFLRAQGLDTRHAFAVRAVDVLPAPISAAAFGGYLNPERRAYLLSYAKIAARGTIFGLPIDRTLYRSLAAHEVTHAIAAADFSIAKPSLEADEYIAYVAMFATLPAPYRETLLARFKDDSFADERQINSLVYFLDPFRFGALAYKHFMLPANGAPFLRRVLCGRALLDIAF